MTFKNNLRRVMRAVGYDVHRFQTQRLELSRRLLRDLDVGLVLDVGANEGQYAQELRGMGYDGPMWSFEPGREAFSELERVSSGDALWQVFDLALGAKAGSEELHISRNSVSSSLLPMAALHERVASNSAYIASEQVTVRTLDEISVPDTPLWLKIDTQGSEWDVLRGAQNTLPRVRFLQLEISFASLYVGQPDYRSLLATVLDYDFKPIYVESALQDSWGRMLQIDVLFERDGT